MGLLLRSHLETIAQKLLLLSNLTSGQSCVDCRPLCKDAPLTKVERALIYEYTYKYLEDIWMHLLSQ